MGVAYISVNINATSKLDGVLRDVAAGLGVVVAEAVVVAARCGRNRPGKKSICRVKIGEPVRF